MQPDLTLTPTPSKCEYLPDRVWQLRYELFAHLKPPEYLDRLKQGWRRFGHVLFRPECPGCRGCQSIRVPVATFRPNQSQRRAWKQNVAGIRIRIGMPIASPDRVALFKRFQQHQHDAKGWPLPDHTLEPFLDNPFATEEWCYYVGSRLVGVGYVDALQEGLSAIYFYYDPAERHRSLGTFNVLALIASAQQRRLPHVYLGYFVEGCGSLEYKARFRPNEVLGVSGAWEPFT